MTFDEPDMFLDEGLTEYNISYTVVQASARTVRRRLDEAGLFGRVARIEYPFTEENITAPSVDSLESTKAGLTTNGRAFYSAGPRPTSVLVSMDKYGFNVLKMRPT